MSLLARFASLAARHVPRDRRPALRSSYLGLRVRLHPVMKAVHGTFTAADLRRHLEQRVGPFEILMVHSSVNYMRPYYRGSPLELLCMLEDHVGPRRTLAMPAFSLGNVPLTESFRRNPRFDARHTPSQMGLLTELFRRRDGVKVSVHPSHRVAALGPLAEALTATHLHAGTTFGRGTPFDVMAAHDTAIIGIGKSSEVLTQVHHAEDLLGPDFPVPDVVIPLTVTVTDTSGREQAHDLRSRVFQRPRKMEVLRELMDARRLQEWQFHGVPLFHTRAAWVTEDLLAAAGQGRTIYSTVDADDQAASLERTRPVRLLHDVADAAGKAGAVIGMMRLDVAGARHGSSGSDSLHGTLKWLMRAQDSTPDDGVSYGYSLQRGWIASYPETTGYILQTFLKYHEIFGGDEVLERARRMAHWEVDRQLTGGGTPGNSGHGVVPVAFNTGQVLLGWAGYLRRFPEDGKVEEAAVRAGRWLVRCMGGRPWFEGGVSAMAEHGDLSYNSMVSWGMAELGDALGDRTLTSAAHASAVHYATLVDERNWPYRSGFSDADSAFPLTHTLGYTIQGLIETARLTHDDTLRASGQKLLEGARHVIDRSGGFLPGRVHPGWNGGAPWACLTGSAQLACSFLRLALMGHGRSDDVEVARQLVGYVVSTQLTESCGRPEIAWGVRGSYPFALHGYERATWPAWAAKFLVDAEILLHQLECL
jgi:aminoglycoside N3'-acetyltransferase